VGAARFEGDVEGVLRVWMFDGGERLDLCVRATGAAMPPPRDDPSVAHDDRAHGRIRGGEPEALAGFRDGLHHEFSILA